MSKHAQLDNIIDLGTTPHHKKPPQGPPKDEVPVKPAKPKQNVKFVDKQRPNSIYEIPLNAVEVRPGEYVSMTPSVINTTENVGISRTDIEVGDMAELSMSHLHPCMFCNVTLRHGVIIIAAFEIVVWSLLLGACIAGLTYWLDREYRHTSIQLASTVYNTSNVTHFKVMKEALIVQTTICAAFVVIGVLLLFGAILKKSSLLIAWLLLIAFLTTGRIAAAIYFDVSFMRWGLFYWFLRAFEIVCVYVYMSATRRMEQRQGKRRRQRDSTTPEFVPVTYYGIMQKVHKKDSDMDVRTIRSIGDGASNKSYKVQYVNKTNPEVKVTTKKNIK